MDLWTGDSSQTCSASLRTTHIALHDLTVHHDRTVHQDRARQSNYTRWMDKLLLDTSGLPHRVYMHKKAAPPDWDSHVFTFPTGVSGCRSVRPFSYCKSVSWCTRDTNLHQGEDILLQPQGPVACYKRGVITNAVATYPIRRRITHDLNRK